MLKDIVGGNSMNDKVTIVRPAYPLGEEPNLCIPEKYNAYHRFLLGRLGTNPLVAICMNPSAANEDYSDRTINRIINASKKLYEDKLAVNSSQELRLMKRYRVLTDN